MLNLYNNMYNYTSTEVAQAVGIKSASKINNLLTYLNVIRKSNDIDGYMLTKKYLKANLGKNIVKTQYGKTTASIRWSSEGVEFIRSLWEKYHIDEQFVHKAAFGY